MFKKHCKSCHDSQVGDRDSWWRSDGNIKMIPVGPNKKGLPPVETDPLMARNAMRKAIGTLDDRDEATTLAAQLNDLTFQEVTWILPKLRLFGELLSSFFDLDKFGVSTQPMITQGIEAYKARPLDGIWATAPYLHNGSAPNLYELLLPPDQRTRRFCVGEREFDPIKVGFVMTQDCPPEKLLDTTIEGNHNSGHNYGNPELTDEDRWDLVEYQKAL